MGTDSPAEQCSRCTANKAGEEALAGEEMGGGGASLEEVDSRSPKVVEVMVEEEMVMDIRKRRTSFPLDLPPVPPSGYLEQQR